MTHRCTRILPQDAPHPVPMDIIVLTHAERHLRRKLLHLQHGDAVMLDLEEPAMLAHGDLLALDGGGVVEIIAAEEFLYDIRPRDPLHLVELAWHLGNRHLPAQIEAERILIARDPVIHSMLVGLGARVQEVSEPFHPLRGAYHAQFEHEHRTHEHSHNYRHSHDHGHSHHECDHRHD